MRCSLLLASIFLAAATAFAAPATIRIKAAATQPHTDELGVVWEADHGFEGGETIARPDLKISNTKIPSLYRSERYSMTRFTRELPNGRYTVKLHFSETFEGVTAVGERVFSFNVEGIDFKDFDIYKLAGGGDRAHVVVVRVEIKDGRLDITFTPKVENPQINALEIIPEP